VSPGAEPHVDLLVLGAGPAGAATAMELARSGLTVLIVDASAGRGEQDRQRDREQRPDPE